MKLCSLKKNYSGIEKFSNEVTIRFKKAKKLFWLKKKKHREAKMQNIDHMILQLIEDKEKDQPISKEVIEYFKRESEDHDISEIPDYFLCKVNYVNFIFLCFK